MSQTSLGRLGALRLYSIAEASTVGAAYAAPPHSSLGVEAFAIGAEAPSLH